MNSRSLIILLLITFVAARGNFRPKQPSNQDQAHPPPPPLSEKERNQLFDEIKRPTIIQDATKDSQKAIGNVNGNEQRDWREVKSQWKNNQIEAEIKQKQTQNKNDQNELLETNQKNDQPNLNNFNPEEERENKKQTAEEFDLREELREARRKRREDGWNRVQEKTEEKKQRQRDDYLYGFLERNSNNNSSNQDHQP